MFCPSVAQLVERLSYTQLVPGSSPGGRTKYLILSYVCLSGSWFGPPALNNKQKGQRMRWPSEAGEAPAVEQTSLDVR